MYFKKIVINGVEYPIAVTITGIGPPTDSVEAEVGMKYMDTDNQAFYKRTPSGWAKEIYGESGVEGFEGNWDEQGVSYLKFLNFLIQYDADMGEIETALDNIIAMQNLLIGGETV